MVAFAFAALLAYRNFPPPFAGPNLGLAIFVVGPVAVLAGLLVAHGIYRLVPRDERSPPWLVVYPVTSAGGIALVGTYIAFVTESVSYGSLPELVVPALIAGGVVAGAVWATDRIRLRRHRDEAA